METTPTQSTKDMVRTTIWFLLKLAILSLVLVLSHYLYLYVNLFGLVDMPKDWSRGIQFLLIFASVYALYGIRNGFFLCMFSAVSLLPLAILAMIVVGQASGFAIAFALMGGIAVAIVSSVTYLILKAGNWVVLRVVGNTLKRKDIPVFMLALGGVIAVIVLYSVSYKEPLPFFKDILKERFEKEMLEGVR